MSERRLSCVYSGYTMRHATEFTLPHPLSRFLFCFHPLSSLPVCWLPVAPVYVIQSTAAPFISAESNLNWDLQTSSTRHLSYLLVSSTHAPPPQNTIHITQAVQIGRNRGVGKSAAAAGHWAEHQPSLILSHDEIRLTAVNLGA